MKKDVMVPVVMAAMLALCFGASCEENVLIDNFTKEVPGRWTTARGEAWKIKDGVFSSVPKNGPYQTGMAVCDFPIIDGVIEVVVRSRTDRFGSVGIVGTSASRRHERTWALCPGDSVARRSGLQPRKPAGGQ